MSLFYTKKFYMRDYARTSRSARCIAPLLIDAFNGASTKLNSVIDIGCGRGVWLDEFKKLGVGLLKGRDGAWVQSADPLVGQSDFVVTNLAQPYREPHKYDLAMTLEVAEHIDEGGADTFITSIVELSDTIMFSAAIKGQGGQHHVNERPLAYWIAKFAAHGFSVYDPIRPRIWGNDDVCWWYRQNIVIFSRDGTAMQKRWQELHNSAPHIYDMAHPVGFAQKASLANLFSPEEYVGLWASKLKRKIFGGGSAVGPAEVPIPASST